MSKERITTLHPQGKKGVRILRSKYDVIKDYVMKTIEDHEEISYESLNDMALRDLSETFDGKVGWYVVTVKLDLEARGMIVRVPRSSPHRLRIGKVSK